MKKNFKKTILGIATALIVFVNVLTPNQVSAKSLVSARVVHNSSNKNSPVQEQKFTLATIVIVVIFVAVATIEGLGFNDNSQANLNNLDN